MRNLLVPAVVLVVLPALYFGRRLGLHRDPWIRRIGIAALVLTTLAAVPWKGLDFDDLKRIDLFLCAALAAAYAAAHRGWMPRPRLRALGLAAVAAVTVYYNFFAFHGERVWVHLHDVVHYYLGSKYYAEIDYGDLYTAMLRAESELYDDHFKTIEARDLRTYRVVHIRTLLQERSGEVKAAFTGARWRDFKADVRYFRETLDRLYPDVLLDHGFNPTPVWALIGGGPAGMVKAGDAKGIFLLTLLDVVLLLGVFGAVLWAWGREAALLAVIHYCVLFGVNYGWTGGGYLRYLWLFGLVAGLACLRRGRPGTAGAFLGLATMLRVFPAFFVLPLFFKGLVKLWRRRARPGRRLPLLETRLALGFGASCLALFLLSLTLPRGFDHWRSFKDNMELHVRNISPNVVGMTDLLAYQPGFNSKVTQEEFDGLKDRRAAIHRRQLLTLFPAVLALVLWLCRWQTPLGASLLAVPLLLAGQTLAAYYYAFMILLVIWRRHSSRDLALIFAAEALSYVLLVFESRDGMLYLYRSLVVAYLCAALYLPALQRGLRLLRRSPAA